MTALNIIVCKFGGASTASAEGFRRIRAILSRDPRRRYAVLSAPGSLDGGPKVTDLLEQAWQLKASGHDPTPTVDAVVARFHGIAHGLGLPAVDDEARAALQEGLSVSRPHTLSRGELLCARLFSEYAGLPMADAAEIVAFDAHGRMNASATMSNVIALTRRLPRAVIPGFYGALPDGRLALLPRNGSDISGALVAAGAGAMLYENWTDVPGLMTGDPATDPDARLIPGITYPAMRDLAQAGARVLHPDCLAPVAQAGIPTRLRNIYNPEAMGTLVR